MKKKQHQQIKMFKVQAPAAHVHEENTRCGLCSTLQPPIVIHHPELLGPLNNTAIQAWASAYIANIPPEPHPTDTRKYLITQGTCGSPATENLWDNFQMCRTGFSHVGQVSDLWDVSELWDKFQISGKRFRPVGQVSSCIKIKDKS